MDVKTLIQKLQETAKQENAKPKFAMVPESEVEILRKENSIIHFISKKTVDSVRDIIYPEGVDYSEFEKYRTVFYNHNYNLPIAKNLWLKPSEDGVLSKTQFSKKNSFAQDVYNLHVEGILNSWSIGIFPKLDEQGQIEPLSIIYEEKSNTWHWHKCTLLEYSSATIPANTEALDVIKGMTKSTEAQQIVKTIEMDTILEKMAKEHEKEIQAIKSFFDEVKGKFDDNVEYFNKYSEEIKMLKQDLRELTDAISIIQNKLASESKANMEILDAKKIEELIFNKLKR